MPAVLVPMKTPTRALPQRFAAASAAFAKPSRASPISAARLLRQS
jgi:hypothetical protein